MPDADDPLAFLDRPVTPQLVESARRHLMMLRSLHEDVRHTVPALCPPGTGAWRSTAADRYLERLEELRSLLIRALACLAEAETTLEERTRRLQSDLDAQPVARTGWR